MLLLGRQHGRGVQPVGLGVLAAPPDAAKQRMKLVQGDAVGMVTMRVFALEITIPVSLIVVHAFSSMSLFHQTLMIWWTCFSPFLACAMVTCGSGISVCILSAMDVCPAHACGLMTL